MRKVQRALEIDYAKVQYPLLGTEKFDGCFGTISNGEIVFREGDKVPCRQLHEQFAEFVRYASEVGIVPEFEILAKDFRGNIMGFNEISGQLRSFDVQDAKFMLAMHDVYELGVPAIFRYRKARKFALTIKHFCDVIYVEPVTLLNAVQAQKYMVDCKAAGFEGAVFKSPMAHYKEGRATLKGAEFLRDKGVQDWTGIILEVIESIDKHGVPTGMAHSAEVCVPECGGVIVKVALTRNLTDAQRREIWKNRGQYKSRELDFTANYAKNMEFRSPIFKRWR